MAVESTSFRLICLLIFLLLIAIEQELTAVTLCYFFRNVSVALKEPIDEPQASVLVRSAITPR